MLWDIVKSCTEPNSNPNPNPIPNSNSNYESTKSYEIFLRKTVATAFQVANGLGWIWTGLVSVATCTRCRFRSVFICFLIP